MRLDKFLSECSVLSRRETAKAVRAGRLSVNGTVITRPDVKVNETKDVVALDGIPVAYAPFVYIWLNKPAGYVSATEDGKFPVVTDLLPEDLRRRGIFPCGRLDKDTLGWMLLTDDGELAHRLLSPKRHVEKIYRFSCQSPLCSDAELRLLQGITSADGTRFQPARLLPDPQRMGGQIVLTEGKYHEIKRMLEALDNKITALRRISFGGIAEDTALSSGSWRFCTEEELSLLRIQAGL